MLLGISIFYKLEKCSIISYLDFFINTYAAKFIVEIWGFFFFSDFTWTLSYSKTLCLFSCFHAVPNEFWHHRESMFTFHQKKIWPFSLLFSNMKKNMKLSHRFSFFFLYFRFMSTWGRNCVPCMRTIVSLINSSAVGMAMIRPSWLGPTIISSECSTGNPDRRLLTRLPKKLLNLRLS